MNKKYLVVLAALCTLQLAFATSPQELLIGYEAKSGKAIPARGEKFFTAKHGKEWRCASCHEALPNHVTKHIVTGKVIQPLSPTINHERFKDPA